MESYMQSLHRDVTQFIEKKQKDKNAFAMDVQTALRSAAELAKLSKYQGLVQE